MNPASDDPLLTLCPACLPSRPQQMSDEIKRKQEQCVETEAALLECCKQYESVSRPAASLYITLASLASVSPMYQFSLRWYVDLYVAVIDTT